METGGSSQRRVLDVRPATEVRRSARYALTGFALYALDFSVFFVLTVVGGVHVAVSQFVARSVGAIAGFYGHRSFTFQENRRDPALGLAAQWSAYTIVSAATIFASPLFIMIAMRVTGDRQLLAKVVTEPFLVLMAYVGLRFVFRARSGHDRGG